MSVALTLCRGRSHDDYYFQRPQRITSDPPPQPYVDMRRESILKRVLAKEILRQAFSALNLFAAQGVATVSTASSGELQDWNQRTATAAIRVTHQARRLAQLVVGVDPAERQRGRANTSTCFWSYSDPTLQAQRQALINYCLQQLVPLVTQYSTDPRFPQDALSERLANAGILPMFGFPTRTRYLFHDRPTRAYPWPPG